MDEDKVELKSDQAAYVYNDEKIEELTKAVERAEADVPVCVDCEHPFHYSRCFATIEVGRAFTQCRCKKGVREDDN